MGIVTLLGLAALQGCSLGDIIQTEVPPTIQEVVPGTEQFESLNDVIYVRGRYVYEVTSALEQLDENIENASLIRDTVSAFLNTGLSTAAGPIASLPGGGFLALGLGSLGGLFLQKPGTTKTIQQEKERSFNAGLRRAHQIANTVEALDNAVS